MLFRFGEPFSTGACEYLDACPDMDEALARVYVRLQPEGLPFEVLALLDTGAHYCLLNEQAASFVSSHLTTPLGEVSLRTAHGPVRGEIYIHKIRLIAEEGEPLDIETTLFLPLGWQGPSILGYTGALDRMRFALDPQMSTFFFGSLG